MTSPVTCRGLPLCGLPAADGSDGQYYVSVHELSVQLWKNFDTPRVSVQKKIEDLGIPLARCNRSQVDVLRQKGVVQGFRATLVSIKDAEKLCDALQHSREKRGLVKHPLNVRKRRKRREDVWLLKMKARICSGASSEVLIVEKAKDPLVDECALIGVAATPTPSNYSPGGTPPSNSDSSLKAKQIPVAEKELANQEPLGLKGTGHGIEHVIVKDLNHFLVPSRGLEALDLCVGSSENMATLRSYLLGGVNKTGTGSLQGSKHISRSSSAITSPRGRPPKNPPLLPDPLPLKRPHLHSAVNPKNHINRIMSPPATFQGCSPEIEQHSASNQEVVLKPKRADRFLYWSDDDETGHAKHHGSDDVILVRVENTRTASNVANDGKSANGAALKPNSRPHPKRVVTTKLRHFAHTTSPTSAASASPGKQIPLGSTHTQRSKRCQHKALWVRISRSLLKNTPAPLTNARHPLSKVGHSSNLHNSVPEPSYLTTPYSNKKGRPSLNSKCRPKPALSNFATLKRARALSPIEGITPAKRQKVSENSVGTLAKSDGKSSRPGRGVSEKRVLGEEAGSTPRCRLGGTPPPVVGGVKVGKPLPSSNDHGLGGGSGTVEEEGPSDSVVGSSATSRVSGEPSSGTRARHRGTKVMSERDGSHFNFEQLFDYYPPKLVVQDGDLCPEHSLSVGGLERSKLSSLPQTHPFWNWTLGQPISKAAAPNVKTSRRKQKSKTTNNVP